MASHADAINDADARPSEPGRHDANKNTEQETEQVAANQIVALVESLSHEKRGELLVQFLSQAQHAAVQDDRIEPTDDNESTDQNALLAPPREAAPEDGDLLQEKQDYDEESVESDWHSPFNESTFTLLYMCRFESQGFWYGVFIYTIQMATLLLTMADITGNANRKNILNLPAMVDLTVTVAQGVALFMAIAYQSDLIDAVLKLQDGHYAEVMEIHDGATYATWLISCLAQLMEGLCLLASVFVLIMQVDNVLDIMLNFAALSFIAEIDDLAFAMAKLGFVTNTLQQQALEVADFKLPMRAHRNRFRRFLYLMTLSGLFTGYAILKERQLAGYYLQSYIYVQFGDAFNPKIPYYSGLLSCGNYMRTAGHRDYRDLGTENILLGYCEAEQAWTFSETNDSCDYFARSYTTKTYDVTTIADAQWEVLDPQGRLKPFDSFSLVGRDCHADTCYGECIEGLCHCPHDRFGIDCEFDNVCSELVLQDQSKPFPAGKIYQAYASAISDEFSMLRNNETGEYVRVYYMPVYYSNKTYPANVIFFVGRRWVLTTEADLFNYTAFGASQTLLYHPQLTAKLLMERFHGYQDATYTPIFLSDPVDYETPDFLPTPIGLGWSASASVDDAARLFVPNLAVDGVLTCRNCTYGQGGSCDVFGGTCNHTTGTCECRDGYHGEKCELEGACYEMGRPCISEGVCDDVSGICRCNLPWFGKLCTGVYACVEEYGGCRNGGVCNQTSTGCDCPEDPAVSGFACEKRKDCKVFGCENGGKCEDFTGRCVCPKPYEGFLCNLVNETQKEALCLADAVMQNTTLCRGDFDCTISSCRNEGICNNSSGLCECQEPFAGRDCSEVPPCSSNEDCIGGGICAIGQCFCSNWFARGRRCENTTFSGCQVDGCFNGGSCLPSGTCQCPTPYSGVSCELFLDVAAFHS